MNLIPQIIRLRTFLYHLSISLLLRPATWLWNPPEVRTAHECARVGTVSELLHSSHPAFPGRAGAQGGRAQVFVVFSFAVFLFKKNVMLDIVCVCVCVCVLSMIRIFLSS